MKLAIFTVLAALLSPGSTLAQEEGALSGRVTNLTNHRGRYFLQTSPGTVGITLSKSCRPDIDGLRVYLPRDGGVYWGAGDVCVRIVVNHKSVDIDKPPPSYLLFQIVGYYDVQPETNLVLQRTGAFTRGSQLLPPREDRSFHSKRFSLFDFDSTHVSPTGKPTPTVEHSDELLGFRWHGAPADGKHNSWDERWRFTSETQADATLNLKLKALDNRLHRFTAYSGEPSDGPVGTNVKFKAARAMSIKVFSPYSSEYSSSFTIISSDRIADIRRITTLQMAEDCPAAGLLQRFWCGN